METTAFQLAPGSETTVELVDAHMVVWNAPPRKIQHSSQAPYATMRITRDGHVMIVRPALGHWLVEIGSVSLYADDTVETSANALRPGDLLYVHDSNHREWMPVTDIQPLRDGRLLVETIDRMSERGTIVYRPTDRVTARIHRDAR